MDYTQSDGKAYVRGVASSGPSRGCESSAPLTYTRVSFYLDWISAHTGIAIDR